MNLHRTLQILIYGMPKKTKSNILDQKVSRKEYLKQIHMELNQWIFLHIIRVNYPWIRITAIIIILLLGLTICYLNGVSCVESGLLRNFINGGGL